MIFSYIFTVLISGINWLFMKLPVVTTLPTIAGYDIDSALVSAMGQFTTVTNNIWVLHDLWLAFLFLVGYWTLKLVLKVLLGNRTPIHYN